MWRIVALGEQFAQRAVVGVAPGAVGHQPPGGDAVLGEPGQRALDERGDGVGAFVGEQLAVGQAAVVVDDGVEVVVAERVATCLRTVLRRSPVTAWPGAPKARVALDVHMQQIAGARPLVATERRRWAPCGARQAVAARIAWTVECATPVCAGDQPRTPTRAHALRADARLELGIGAPRRAMRAAGAIQRPSSRRRAPRRWPHARAPHQRCAVAGATERQAAACLSVEPSLDQPDQLAAPSRSELGVSVHAHPGPPRLWSPSQDPQPQDGPGRLLSRSQPAWARQLAPAPPTQLPQRLAQAPEPRVVDPAQRLTHLLELHLAARFSPNRVVLVSCLDQHGGGPALLAPGGRPPLGQDSGATRRDPRG